MTTPNPIQMPVSIPMSITHQLLLGSASPTAPLYQHRALKEKRIILIVMLGRRHRRLRLRSSALVLFRLLLRSFVCHHRTTRVCSPRLLLHTFLLQPTFPLWTLGPGCCWKDRRRRHAIDINNSNRSSSSSSRGSFRLSVSRGCRRWWLILPTASGLRF